LFTTPPISNIFAEVLLLPLPVLTILEDTNMFGWGAGKGRFAGQEAVARIDAENK
jgi:hypothetical protein